MSRQNATLIRFVREIQYVIGAVVDSIIGDETRRLWAAHCIDRQLSAPITAVTSRKRFARTVQAALEVKDDGDPGPITWAAWTRHAYPEVIAAAVHPLPIYHGAKPVMSSGFNRALGPNWSRDHHLGNDLEYHWDGEGSPPEGWLEYHFGWRPERRFYGPAVRVYAVLPGVVQYAKMLDVSPKWGGPRWAVKISHGTWPGLGHVVSWSTHHQSVLVAAGDTVQADTPIAILGDTGARGAPHDHHELWRWRDGETVDRQTAPFDPAPIFGQLSSLGPA